MPCKYFAPNGKPSQLFDRLFSYYTNVHGMKSKQAELAAVTSWLSTRSKAYVDFAGHTEDDTTTPHTQTLDQNGEPELLFLGRSNHIRELKSEGINYGMGWDFTTESVSDYAAFVSIKQPKIVDVTDGFTAAQFNEATYALRGDEFDGVIFTRTGKDGSVEKQYVLKDVEQIQPVYNSDRETFNLNYDTWESANSLRERVQDTLPTQPVTNFTTADDNSMRLLQSVVKGDNVPLAKIARSILIKAAKKIPVTQVPGGSIQYQNNTIEVGKDTTVTRERFETLITTEVLKGYLTEAFDSNQLPTFDNIYAAAPSLFGNSQTPAEYFSNRAAFLNGFMSDRLFYQLTKDTIFPGTKDSVRDLLFKDMAALFDFRDSYLPALADLIESNQAIRQRAGKVLYQTDLGEETPEQEPEEQPKPKPQVNMAAPYAHLMTGDKVIDNRIAATFDKLQSLRSRLSRNKKQTENTRIRAEISKYQKELDQIVEHRSTEILLNVGQRDMIRMQSALDRDLTHNEVWENLNLLESWLDFSSYFEPSEVDPQIMYSIRQISINALELYNKYNQLYWNSVTSAMAEEGVPVQYLSQISPDQVIEDIGALAANFIGLSFGEHGLEVAADFIIRQTAAKINTGLIDFQQRLEEKISKLPSKDISFMFKQDENGKYRPITSYKSEIYETVSNLRYEVQGFEKERQPLYDQKRELNNQYREAVAAKDKTEMLRVQTRIDQVNEEIKNHKARTKSYGSVNEFMRNNFDYELSDKGLLEFQEFSEILKEGYYDYNPETGEMEFAELKYQFDLQQHDPSRLKDWIAGKDVEYPRYAAKYFAITPKAKWKNDDYDKFTPAQKDFYDFFVKEYLSAQSNVPMDYSFTDYDSDRLLREFSFMDAESLSKFKYITKEVKDFFKDIATVKYYDNEISYDRTAPLSKRQVKKLKFKHISEFTKGTDGFWKEGDELPTSLKDGLAAGRYKYKDGYLVVSSAGSQNEKMVKKIISKNDNPLDIFNNYIKFSLAYKYKTEVQDTLNGIQELAYAIPKESTQNRGKVNPLGLRFGAKNGSNFEKRLGYTMDAFLTGNLKDPLPMTTKGKPGERVFSGGQLLDSINNLTRVRQLGLNPISGISNLSMGTAANFMYAARNEFFNESELRKGYSLIKDSIATFYTGGQARIGNSQKIMLMLNQFNMLGNLQEKFYMDKEWVEKAFEHIYIFQKGGEYINQGATLLAMMQREKIKTEDGREVSLWDAFEVKDGKLNYKYPNTKYADQQQLFIFAEAAKKINKEIHGDYDILNPIGAKRQVYGRVGMLFRTWMPQAIKQRLGNRYKDYQLSMFKGEDVYREGRWRTGARFLGGFDKKGSTMDPVRIGENVLKFIGAIAASTISNKLGRKIINDSRLDATDRANMYANVKEAWWLTVLSIATTLMIHTFKSDDDDEDPITQSWLKYLYNQTSRVESELWFFYDPISFSKIFRDAVPMWSTLKQAARTWDSSKNFVFDNEADTYQRGFRKGDSKFATQLQLFFPVSKQAQSIWSMGSEFYSDKYY